METRIFAHINILYGLKTVQKSLFILVLLALMGCGGRPAADCVREADGLLVVRFDNAVEDYLHTGTFSSLLRLRTDFPAETRILVEDVLRLGSAGDDSLGEKLRRFYADTTLVRLRADVGRKFGNFAPYERELREAFARMRRVCPDMPLPTVYTLNSAFRQSIVVSDRLLGITGELLNMTQVEAGKLQLMPKITKPIELIEYAIKANRVQAEKFGIQIEVEYPEEKMPKLFVDSEKIAWVLTNLLSNAIRYSKENGRVIIGASREGEAVAMYVRDFGKGIDPRYHQSIFDRYFRVPGTKVQGSGLGLSISKDFVEAHGGTLTVESQLGKGSRFVLRLKV